jgi:glucosylceramidase
VLIEGCARAAVGSALAAFALRRDAIAQLPPPEPLSDDLLTFVTTTEASAWQTGKIFKPTFSWELLNLNVNLEQTGPTPMDGFGGCFNELGWTSGEGMGE